VVHARTLAKDAIFCIRMGVIVQGQRDETGDGRGLVELSPVREQAARPYRDGKNRSLFRTIRWHVARAMSKCRYS
jgi:hypothetical protein